MWGGISGKNRQKKAEEPAPMEEEGEEKQEKSEEKGGFF